LAGFDYSGHEIDDIASHPTFVLKFL